MLGKTHCNVIQNSLQHKIQNSLQHTTGKNHCKKAHGNIIKVEKLLQRDTEKNIHWWKNSYTGQNSLQHNTN